MIIEKRIKEFEKLGFGMFVHFGLYSILVKANGQNIFTKYPIMNMNRLKINLSPIPIGQKSWRKPQGIRDANT